MHKQAQWLSLAQVLRCFSLCYLRFKGERGKSFAGRMRYAPTLLLGVCCHFFLPPVFGGVGVGFGGKPIYSISI
jgi:hypothetical protein